MAREIKLKRNINASPDEVYLAITSPFTIELWTGLPATLELIPGGDISMLDGGISGKIVEFEENKRLVQLWSFGEENEPSLVIINLEKEKNRTVMTVLQENIPEEAYDNMLEGWKDVIFKGLKDFFG